jgi:hypothetical protein
VCHQPQSAACNSANLRRLAVAQAEVDAPLQYGVVEEAAHRMILYEPQFLHLFYAGLVQHVVEQLLRPLRKKHVSATENTTTKKHKYNKTNKTTKNTQKTKNKKY